METRQISITIPEVLFKKSEKLCEEFGYESIQEFIREILRKNVMDENLQRYTKIEARMKLGKGVRKFSNSKSAVQYLERI